MLFCKHLLGFFSTKKFVFWDQCPLLHLRVLIHHFLFKVLSLCSWFTVKAYCAWYLNAILLIEVVAFSSFCFFSLPKRPQPKKQLSVEQSWKSGCGSSPACSVWKLLAGLGRSGGALWKLLVVTEVIYCISPFATLRCICFASCIKTSMLVKCHCFTDRLSL